MFFDVHKPRIQEHKYTSWKSKVLLCLIKGSALAPGIKYYNMVDGIALYFKLSANDSFMNSQS